MGWWSILLIVSNWLIRIAMTPIVMRRRRPASAMGWLLVIYFQPWIGLLIYLLLGENRLPLRRIRRHDRAQIGFHGGVELVSAPHVVKPKVDPEQQSLVRLAERLGHMPILGGNQTTLLTETEDVIERLIADIDAAEHHVHLLFYIFSTDSTGWRVAEALVRARRRGVACRLLADDVGSWGLERKLAPWMIERGVDVHFMLPVNIFRRRLARIDLRNHRKIAVMDGRIAYTGSQNIVDATYGPKKLPWHDMMVRVTGPVVSQLQNAFVEDWLFECGELLDNESIFPPSRVCGEVPVQTLPSGPSYPTENYQRLVIASLYQAKEHVVMTTPYFVPDEPFLQALQVASMSGVKVDLIVPRRSDQRVTHAAGRAYYEDLLRAGVRIHRHNDGLLHAKTMTVDDAFALIGSGNFDMRSFYLNFELNLVLYGARVTAELRRAQSVYIRQSRPLTLETWNQRSRGRRILDDAAKLLSPLL